MVVVLLKRPTPVSFLEAGSQSAKRFFFFKNNNLVIIF